MSLLSSTQGNFERVRSLVQVLAAHGGELPRASALSWLQPRWKGLDHEPSSSAGTQIIGACRSLGFLQEGSDPLQLRNPSVATDIPTFADLVHEALVSAGHSDPAEDELSISEDAVPIWTYAWFVVRCDLEKGTSWISATTAKDLEGAIDGFLRGTSASGTKLFNTTKLPYWRRWLSAAGLIVDTKGRYFPDLSPRLARELAAVAIKRGSDTEIPIEDLLEDLRPRMPYLDGGEFHLQAVKRLRFAPPPQQLSFILSAGLRTLHEDGVIELSTIGDAPSQSLFPEDITTTKAVRFVTIKSQADQ